MSALLQDLRYGARMLLKRPGFTFIAVVMLALGIGANTAIFSVVDAALIRALPYHNPSRLILLSGVSGDGGRDLMSMEEMREFQTRARSLEDMAGMVSQSVNLTGGERPDRVRGAYVTANFFQVFNLMPVAGRTFAPGEDRLGAEKVVVVNEKIWRERLGGAPDLTGKKLILNGEPFNVIGVAIGLASAWLLTRLIANLLFGVSATDPLTFGSIPLLLAIVALLACWIPARRATKVDPIIALRYE